MTLASHKHKHFSLAVGTFAAMFTSVHAWPRMDKNGHCEPGLQYCSYHLDTASFPADASRAYRQSPSAVWTCEANDDGVPKIELLMFCGVKEYCMAALEKDHVRGTWYMNRLCGSSEDFNEIYTPDPYEWSKDWKYDWFHKEKDIYYGFYNPELE